MNSTLPSRNLLFRTSSFGLIDAQPCHSATKFDTYHDIIGFVGGPCGLTFSTHGQSTSQERYYMRLQCPEYPTVSLPSRVTRHRKVSTVQVTARVVWRMWYRWTSERDVGRTADKELFLNALREACCRAQAFLDEIGVYVAPASFYSLAREFHNCTTELFASVLDESGVMETFCRLFKEDESFGSIGSWEDRETNIISGAANPPFRRHVIQRIVQRFDEGFCRDQPYFRIAILPGDLETEASLPTTHGETILRIPGGCLPFTPKRSLLMANTCTSPRPHWKLHLRVIVWVNKLYHLRYPAPLDIEDAYINWCSISMCHAERVLLDTDSMQRAFPLVLRSDVICAQFFSVSNIRKVNAIPAQDW